MTNNLKISPLKIDGGFEFNALYNYGNPPSPGKNWWWVYDDEYVISFLPVNNYETLKIISYQHFIPWRREQIVVSKRKIIDFSNKNASIP